jgi:hypothetical protein
MPPPDSGRAVRPHVFLGIPGTCYEVLEERVGAIALFEAVEREQERRGT